MFLKAEITFCLFSVTPAIWCQVTDEACVPCMSRCHGCHLIHTATVWHFVSINKTDIDHWPVFELKMQTNRSPPIFKTMKTNTQEKWVKNVNRKFAEKKKWNDLMCKMMFTYAGRQEMPVKTSARIYIASIRFAKMFWKSDNSKCFGEHGKIKAHCQQEHIECPCHFGEQAVASGTEKDAGILRICHDIHLREPLGCGLRQQEVHLCKQIFLNEKQ